ncbi:putative baseplate J-like protein [Leptospira inadai serovar Lyme str. 10]|uniref:Baseplate J-like protein n=2 Tax=Leptospira inadai serovar Lyme TaxID=293084 RepID=A0ABX4YLJ8_9LEPT|nr:baseplate J/gp47 family protein [Leptospira inadai]EQA35040.1 putative baseplate J-like protein [Leptospira inadai serovar Lyme str. 10]PNV76148.1 baseplate J-like protein [Leptospira inadai serovar Lyme]
MTFGVTVQGFNRKLYSDILQSLEDRARLPENFGPDIDLSPYGELGMILQNVAKEIDTVWQGLEDTYYSKYINLADGVQLDRIVAQGGISRLPARKSVVQVTVVGTIGATVPPGFLVQTPQGIQFEVVTPAVLTSAAGVEFTFRSIDTGSQTNVPAGAITDIVTPAAGINSVSNSQPSLGGGPVETDAELRQRYKDRESSGGSSLPAIRETLLRVPNVTTVFVYENATSVVVNGRPPHSIEIVVSGTAADSDLGTAIFNSKPAGIETFGTHSFTVADANGQTHVMNWSVPTAKVVNVIVNITKNTNWTDSSIPVVKTRVVQAIGGADTIGTQVTEYHGLDVGQSVVAWEIIANLDKIPGIDDVTVWTAFAPAVPSSSAKLVVGATEFAQTFTANITVNVA